MLVMEQKVATLKKAHDGDPLSAEVSLQLHAILEQLNPFSTQLMKVIDGARANEKEERLQWEAQIKQDEVDLRFIKERGYRSPEEVEELFTERLTVFFDSLLDELSGLQSESADGSMEGEDGGSEGILRVVKD